MGTHRLDGGPSPAAPLWYCLDARLSLACACGRRETLRVGDLFAGQDRDARMWRLVERLRCRACGARPQALDITG